MAISKYRDLFVLGALLVIVFYRPFYRGLKENLPTDRTQITSARLTDLLKNDRYKNEDPNFFSRVI